MKPYNHGKFQDDETFAFNTYLACKEIVDTTICKNHERKLSIDWDYDEFGANIYLSNYCCERFAKAMANLLFERQSVDSIYLVSDHHCVLQHSRTRPKNASTD